MKGTSLVPVNVDSLVDEVSQPRGCKVTYIKDPDAIEFVKRITKMKSDGKEPNIARAAELLDEKWGIYIKRRALTAHARGECSCPKTK